MSAALINGGNAYTAGLDSKKDSIFAEDIDPKTNPNVGQLFNVIVARSKDKDNPVYKKVVDALSHALKPPRRSWTSTRVPLLLFGRDLKNTRTDRRADRRGRQ